MLSLSSTVAGFLAAFLMSGALAAKELNPRTLCPKTGSNGQTLLLVDTTDSLTLKARERLKQLMKEFGDRRRPLYLERYHELIVYRLTPRVADMDKPLLQVCNPGNPDDRTLRDNLTSGLRDAKRKWQQFERLRWYALKQLINERGESKQSPLLEGIALVTARHVPNLDSIEQNEGTRLILFSDMLQNSEHLSHYKSLPTIKAFKRLVGYSEMSSVLDGIDVWLYYQHRTGLEHLQTHKHEEWWKEVIKSFNPRLIKTNEF